MRLGEPKPYTVEGVTFWAASTAAPRYEHREFVRTTMLGAGDWTAEEDAEAGRALERATWGLLAALVVRIEGLEDAEGVAISAWRDDLATLLPEPLVNELARRVYAYESDQAGDAGNAPSGSATSPSTTTEGDQ